ncbi:DNA polymerase III subunit beta [termite gut metagenome]|uniref:DNA polymerase III subunit beta n=1 Tax=termite gut metagenome TaxID=433724 RepID=A0A5J4S217_9ZZZZ
MTKIIPFILPGDESNTEITVFSSHIQIKHNYFTLDCRLIEGKYPNYQSVIPENNDKFLFVNRGIITSALKRVLLFSDSFSSLIALNLSTEKKFLFAQNIDSSTSAKEEIESTFESSNSMEIGFNGRRLLEILTAMPSEEIKMTFSYPEKAAIIKADREDDLLYLLMPSMVAQ